MTGTQQEPGQAFLVVDKIIINEGKLFNDISFIILPVYFVFNIKYPAGCNNIFSCLEIVLLNFQPKKHLSL